MAKIHVSGTYNKRNKAIIKAALELWDGQFLDDTDKGAIFEFSNDADARGFRTSVEKPIFTAPT